MSEWVRGRIGGSVTLYLVDTIATTVLDQSLSNFTCKLWMMKGGTLLILGHGVIGQGQLCSPCEGMPRFALSSFYFVRKGILCLTFTNLNSMTL